MPVKCKSFLDKSHIFIYTATLTKTTFTNSIRRYCRIVFINHLIDRTCHEILSKL